MYPIDEKNYFKKEIDQREILETFNFQILELLKNTDFFEKEEMQNLIFFQDKFTQNTKHLTILEYQSEMERLAIDFSWKSSEIEGNTYSLLETEQLLKYRKITSGKTKEEAMMLLNHKETINFITDNQNYLETLTVAKIESIHSLLIKDLGVEKNIRKRRLVLQAQITAL